jgi:hypothetical protein
MIAHSGGNGNGWAICESRWLGEQQAPPPLWNGAPQLLRRLDPLLDDHLDIRHSFLVRHPIGGAARQFRNLGDERLVLLASI